MWEDVDEQATLGGHRGARRPRSECCQLGRGIDRPGAGAGGAAHLPGVVAAHTELPVIGVPIKTSLAGGLDSLLSIVQMPGGIPVATVAVGSAGAKNAGLYAVAMLALSDQDLAEKLSQFRKDQREKSLAAELPSLTAGH